MNTKEFITQIDNNEINDCDICGQYIWNLDRAILLTRTDRLIFGCIEHENKELLLVCNDCFRELIDRFEITHKIKHFCADTIFDNKILNLR